MNKMSKKSVDSDANKVSNRNIGQQMQTKILQGIVPIFDRGASI